MTVARLLRALACEADRDFTEHPLTAGELRILCRLARRAFWREGCLRLRGYRSLDGYAYFRAQGRRLLAHRWVFETFRGAAAGFDVDHRCHVRDCILHLRTLEPWKNRGWHAPA